MITFFKYLQVNWGVISCTEKYEAADWFFDSNVRSNYYKYNYLPFWAK